MARAEGASIKLKYHEGFVGAPPCDATSAYSPSCSTRMSANLRILRLLFPRVVTMMTGSPESRRVFARSPPLASYSATCSLTHFHALGSYSPSSATSTLYRRSSSSPLGVGRWLRRRDEDVTPLSAHSPTSPLDRLDRVQTVGQDVSSKNALHGLRVVTDRTLFVVRVEMNVDDVVALGEYAKVNTRRVFLRQEVDDGRVLRAFLEQRRHDRSPEVSE